MAESPCGTAARGSAGERLPHRLDLVGGPASVQARPSGRRSGELWSNHAVQGMRPLGPEPTVRTGGQGLESVPSFCEGVTKMADRPVFLYAAVYDDVADAEADYQTVFDLHAAKAIGTFDAAVIEKEDDKVHVHKREKPTQHGAWTGIG